MITPAGEATTPLWEMLTVWAYEDPVAVEVDAKVLLRLPVRKADLVSDGERTYFHVVFDGGSTESGAQDVVLNVPKPTLLRRFVDVMRREAALHVATMPSRFHGRN